MSIRVLHLGSEKTWRGGENQARLLIDGLRSKVEAQFGAVPAKSPAYQEKRWNCELLPLVSGNPGCAVVGSRVGGIPEIIVQEKTSLLIEVGYDKALSEAIYTLIQNREKRKQLNSEAQKWVKNEFSLESMAEGNYRVYQEVLGTSFGH